MATPRKVRSITLTASQDEALASEATRLEIPVAELIRRIFDDWRAGLRKTDGPAAQS